MQTEPTHSITVERVTPAKAERMLNSNNSNRALKPGLVEKYAADMTAGKWTRCTAPIVFYDDGDVADGQHRLWAIVESGTTQEFTIHRGLDRASGLNIDTGRNRDLIDAVRISGIDEGVSKKLVTIARAIALGTRHNGGAGTSNAQQLAWVNAHRAAAEWTLAHSPKGKIVVQSMVLGAIGRAWYYEDDKGRLARFSEVLSNGYMDSVDDAAAVALRNWYIANPGAASRPTTWRDAFLKSQNAIKYFMRRRSLTVIKAVKEETYPLLEPVVAAPPKAKLKKAA